MADSRLFTIRDVARELGLPESTVRYYRNAFAAYLPSVGTGRRRRYPAEAVPLFRLVAEGYAQNRPRLEIEQALSEAGGDQAAATRPAVSLPALAYGAEAGRDELLATVLDGERERREVMWQMAKELVRLGEAIERQQVVLGRLVEAVGGPIRSLVPGGGPATNLAGAPGDGHGRPVLPAAQVASPDDLASQAELDHLRQELARERELVERLRRSKLDIERRAAEAEARLGDGGTTSARRGFFGRLLARENPSRG